MNHHVKVEPRKVSKAICPVHGDIGILNSTRMADRVAQTLHFTLDGREDIFCLRCLRDSLLKQQEVIRVVEEEVY